MHIGTIKEIWRYAVKSMAGEQLDHCTIGFQGIPGDRGWALRNEETREITNGKRIPRLMQCAARYLESPEEAESANFSVPHVAINLSDGNGLSSQDPDVDLRLTATLGERVTLCALRPATDRNHYRRRDPAAALVGRMARSKNFRRVLPFLSRHGQMNQSLREMFSREPDEPIPDISILTPEVIEFTSPPGTYFDAYPINILTTASLKTMTQLNTGAAWDVRRFRPNFLIDTIAGIDGLPEAGWSGRVLSVGSVELKIEIPCVRCGMTMHAQGDLPKDPSILRTIVKSAKQNLGAYASVLTPGRVTTGDVVELLS